MSDKAKCGYLAGIIDGEGCITITVGRRESGVHNYNAALIVTSTDECLIKWLIKHFGGTYYRQGTAPKNCKHAFRWRFFKREEVERILLAILPYLVIKRKQAKLLLEFVRLPRHTQDSSLRGEMYDCMKMLNKRGTGSVTTNTRDIAEPFALA